MTAKTSSDTNGTDEHPAADVETIVVDPEDVIEMMAQNARDEDKQRTHVLRISPPFGGEIRATPHVSRAGHHYDRGTSPAPIHLGAETFLTDGSHPGRRIPARARYPIRNDERSRFRDEYDAHDEDGNPRGLTDEEADEWDEWWSTAVEVWENEVQRLLRDETLLEQRGGSPDGKLTKTKVEIRYESEESE